MKQNVQCLLKKGQAWYLSGAVDDNVIWVTTNYIIKSMRLLKSNHDEANTKMVLHAAYAADVGENNIVISIPDTDVFVLLTYHLNQIDATKLFLDRWVNNK